MCLCSSIKRGFEKSQTLSWKHQKSAHVYVYKGKGKVRSRYRPGVAQKVARGIALLLHDRGARRVWVVSSTSRPHFTPGKDPVPILQQAGWAPGPVWTGGKPRPHRDSIPDRPARSQSLYWLSYPAHTRLCMYVCMYVCMYIYIYIYKTTRYYTRGMALLFSNLKYNALFLITALIQWESFVLPSRFFSSYTSEGLYKQNKTNSVALVRTRTIPTERPPPVGEVSANFCG